MGKEYWDGKLYLLESQCFLQGCVAKCSAIAILKQIYLDGCGSQAEADRAAMLESLTRKPGSKINGTEFIVAQIKHQVKNVLLCSEIKEV